MRSFCFCSFLSLWSLWPVGFCAPQVPPVMAKCDMVWLPQVVIGYFTVWHFTTFYYLLFTNQRAFICLIDGAARIYIFLHHLMLRRDSNPASVELWCTGTFWSPLHCSTDWATALRHFYNLNIIRSWRQELVLPFLFCLSGNHVKDFATAAVLQDVTLRFVLHHRTK